MTANLHPNFGAILAPVATIDIRLWREAALPGFIVRRLFAAAPKNGRQTIVEACKAELAWSVADWRRITGKSGLHHEPMYDGAHPAEQHRMPHEWAAARVLNCHEHMNLTERLIRDSIMCLRAQRAVPGADWAKRADATRRYIRLVWADRARQAKAFHAAVAEYRRLRAVL